MRRLRWRIKGPHTAATNNRKYLHLSHVLILRLTNRMMRPAFSHGNSSVEMSRYSGKSEYDHSQSYAARAGPRYQSSSGVETEPYASLESPVGAFSGVHHTTADSGIAARTSASYSPLGAASDTQKHSPVSTQGLASAQHSCPYDGFSARAAKVSSKTILLRKEVSPDVPPDSRCRRRLNYSIAPSTSKQEGPEGIPRTETKCYSVFGTGS